MDKEAIAQVERAGQIKLNDKQIEQLETYCTFLLEENKKFNITAIKEREQVWLKHFADCAAGIGHIKGAKTLVDVGSGGGFPGIVIAILLPQTEVTLIDSNAKKMDFCRQLCQKISVEANFIVGRVEEQKGKREYFQCATARAVASVGVLLEYLSPITAVGGKIVLYKGDEKLPDKERQSSLLGLDKGKAFPYSLDTICLGKAGQNTKTASRQMEKDDTNAQRKTEDKRTAQDNNTTADNAQADRRNIFVYNKVKNCPTSYPRRNSLIKSNPLF